MNKLSKILLTLGLVLTSINAYSAELLKRTICVFDPVGGAGDVAQIMKDFKLEARTWGVDFTVVTESSESVIANWLKEGKKCDAGALTGIKIREFNNFTPTVEAVGAVLSNKEMKLLLTVMSKNKKYTPFFRQNGYEIAGILPVGPVFALLRDRRWNSVDAIAGKKITYIQGDNASLGLIKQVGANPIPTDTNTFASMFNNGSVDITFAPAVTIAPLELYKGLANGGGIVDLVMSQITFQMIFREDKFPPEIAQKARDSSIANYDKTFAIIDEYTAKVDKKYWVNITEPKLLNQYRTMLGDARVVLSKEGIYHPTVLNLMFKIRCRFSPTLGECSKPYEIAP